ncbi:Luminal-binding protein 4 [Linum grandiflorum]
MTVEIDSHIDGMDFSEPLTRSKFEELNMDLFKKTLEGGSTRIVKVREMLKEMFDGKEPSKSVNPDEAVAYGAAVLGAKLSGRASGIHGVVLVDVTPLSLGILVEGDLMNVVIPRNTSIPTKMSRTYRTAIAQQTSMLFQVFQCERPLTKDCLKLGSFALTGIPPGPRGVDVVEVTFEINVDGILSVTAKTITTGNSESLTISSFKGNFSLEEVERMIIEAEQMPEKDKDDKARIEAKSSLEGYIYDVRSGLDGWDGDKSTVESALREISSWLDANLNASKQDYEERMQKLADIWTPIAQSNNGTR